MNKINQYTKGLLFAALAVAGLSLYSCKDQPDAYEVADGTPTVNYIRCLSSEVQNSNDAVDMHYTNGELVEEASPQSTLCLVGSNLRSVYELYFNDQKAVLNTSYITDNTLIVDVPKSVPVEVTDKIYLVTRDGETVDVDFHVIIPAPSITAMSCEYAAQGERVTFTGDYYVNYEDFPLEVFFTDVNGNPVAATINNIAADFTSIDVTIPDEAAEGPVTMTSIYGTSTSSFYYQDSRGMMFDFDNGRDVQGWHKSPYAIGSEGGIKGNYYQLGDGSATMTEDGGWDDSNFSFEYWCGDPSWSTNGYPDPQGIRLFDIDGVDLSKPENMTLKFEMCIPSSNAWKAGAMQIIFAPTDYVHISGNSPDVYGEEVKGANNIFFRGPGAKDWDDDAYFKEKNPLPRALYRPWTTTGSYDTGGKWQTVTIPIASSFVYGFDGSGLTFNLKERDFASLTMFVVGGGVNGEECQPIIKIDNIRVIPNK
ncbi:MAG: hypothetical protein IJV17_05910 [Prevotella sp.]|nr:hypothetical protein [Prevotella sp.]